MSRVDDALVCAEHGLIDIFGLSSNDRIAIDDTRWPSVIRQTGLIGFPALALSILPALVRLCRAANPAHGLRWQLLALGAMFAHVRGPAAAPTAGTQVTHAMANFLFSAAGLLVVVDATTRYMQSASETLLGAACNR